MTVDMVRDRLLWIHLQELRGKLQQVTDENASLRRQLAQARDRAKADADLIKQLQAKES